MDEATSKVIVTLDDLEFYKFTMRDQNKNEQTFDMQEQLSYSGDQIEHEFRKQASDYIYWASLYERVKDIYKRKELQLEKVEAVLDKRARAEMAEKGEKPTKDSVLSWVKRHDDWIRAKERILDIEFNVNYLARVVRAYEQRKDMLIQVGAQQRQNIEYGNGAGRYSPTDQKTSRVGREFSSE